MTTDNPHQPAYTPKTDDEIRKLAQDYQDGKIFTDRNIYPRDRESMLHLVFKPIVFLSDAARQQFVDLEVVLLYQYKDEATPFATNGYPSFMSMRVMKRTVSCTMSRSCRSSKKRWLSG